MIKVLNDIALMSSFRKPRLFKQVKGNALKIPKISFRKRCRSLMLVIKLRNHAEIFRLL